MTPESRKELDRWTGKCVALMFITLEQVLTGKEINVESWGSVAQHYDSLLSTGEETEAVRRQLNNLGALAHTLGASNLEEAVQAADNIREEEVDVVRLLAKAVIAQRYVKAEGTLQPYRFGDFAESLNSLSHFAPNSETVRKALCEVVRLYRSAVEGFVGQNELEKAIQQGTNFIALANEVLTHFQVSEFLVDALSWGERFIAAFPEPDEESSSSMAVVAHNLINTCRFLAKESDSPGVFFAKQKDIGIYGLRVCRSLGARAKDGLPLSHLHEGLLRGLILSHLNLALVDEANFDEHITAAFTYHNEYQQFVDTWADPDAQQRCAELKLQISNWLYEEKPGWSPPEVAKSDFKALDANLAIEQLEKLRSQAEETVEQIRSLDPNEQLRAISEAIEETYRQLEANFSLIMDEIGLNHHVCRFFIALGAIADGRLGELTVPSVFSWVLSTKDSEDLPRGHRGQIKRRQQLPAMIHFDEEMRCVACLDKLARLAQLQPAQRDWMQRLLRRQNAWLLNSLIPEMAKINYSDHRPHSATNDLITILRSIPANIRRAFAEKYRNASGVSI